MTKKSVKDIQVTPFDDLFKSDKQRQIESGERIIQLNINEIHEFEGHPFQVRMDEDMLKLVDSTKDNGVLVQSLVRPDKNGNGYEMVSGHRRMNASAMNGLTQIPAIIRDLSDDQALNYVPIIRLLGKIPKTLNKKEISVYTINVLLIVIH